MKRELKITVDIPDGCFADFKKLTKTVNKAMQKYLKTVEKKVKKKK